jgi:purine-binding chemotaxis protein CheW
MNTYEEIKDTTAQTETDMEGKISDVSLPISNLFGIPISKSCRNHQHAGNHPVPEYPSHIKGIINLRGRIISVIDMRIRLNKEEGIYNERTCIIVIDISGRHVGFIVDEVKEVLDVACSDISERSQLTYTADNDYLTGFAKLGEDVILLLDMDKILYDSECLLIRKKSRNKKFPEKSKESFYCLFSDPCIGCAPQRQHFSQNDSGHLQSQSRIAVARQIVSSSSVRRYTWSKLIDDLREK